MEAKLTECSRAHAQVIARVSIVVAENRIGGSAGARQYLEEINHNRINPPDIVYVATARSNDSNAPVICII